MKSINVGDMELPNTPFIWSYLERMSLPIDDITTLNNEETIHLYEEIIKVPNISIDNIVGYLIKQINILYNNVLNISLHTFLFGYIEKKDTIDDDFIANYKIDILCHDLSDNINWIDCKNGQWSNQLIWIHNRSLSPFESLRFNIIDVSKESKFVIYIYDKTYDLNFLCLFIIDTIN